MKRLVFFPILMIVCTMEGHSQADTTKGVLFEHGLNWQQVVEKAQKENKYIFVDCYTTWCGPCKWMDKNVYPVDSVGTVMNERFISVKIQMDITGQDNDEIKEWYPSARDLEKKYHVGAYPSYLFFSPDGKAVHKDVGSKNIKDFLSMVRSAMDPQQQYYTLLAEYGKGVMSYPLMPFLVSIAHRVGEDSLSKQIGRDYIHGYLETLPEAQLWTRENIQFVNRYSSFIDINDKIFQLYYRSRIAIDSVFHDGHFSDGLVNEIIYRDEVKPMVAQSLTTTAEPRWRQLEKKISKNYDFISAQRNALHGQVEYYKARKNRKKYIKYFIRQQEINGIESWQAGAGVNRFNLNNNAVEVFEYSNNKRELEKALSWSNHALSVADYPEFMDTKANLLYKLGKKSAALTLEEKSYALAPKNSDIASSYEKMKRGLPTWPTDDEKKTQKQ
jgi:thioredoxin-related protein